MKYKIYYQNDPRINGVYSRDNLHKIKDGAYVINLDEDSDVRTHWVALCTQNSDVTYFDSFGVEHIAKEIKAFIDHSLSIKTNILGKTLTEFTNLFSPNNLKLRLFYCGD